MTPDKQAAPPKKTVNVALQGGGAHGAFTWGVLDALIEDARIDFEALSGTSAGGMNAAAFASGFEKGGAEGARETLHKFWRAVSRVSRLTPVNGTAFDTFLSGGALDTTPAYLFFDTLTRFFSPYDLNPLNLSPLRDIVEKVIDFKALRRHTAHKLYLSATNVHTGRVRVFSCQEITPEVVLASACLPLMYQAVEIDGVPYWDGGFAGNPALFPFFRTTKTEDLLIVQVNPVERRETPRTARDILNRMNEITFNASLIAELRAVEFVQRLVDKGQLEHGGENGYQRVRVHRIDGDEMLARFSASSKFNADWGFLRELRDAGRAMAKNWLEKHIADIGVRETVKLRAATRGEFNGNSC